MVLGEFDCRKIGCFGKCWWCWRVKLWCMLPWRCLEGFFGFEIEKYNLGTDRKGAIWGLWVVDMLWI